MILFLLACTGTPDPTDDTHADTADTDCDGLFYADADGDGFGDPATETIACEAPDGTVDNNTDCDDTDPTVNPDAVDVCTDADCSGAVDSGAVFVPGDVATLEDAIANPLVCVDPGEFDADLTILESGVQIVGSGPDTVLHASPIQVALGGTLQLSHVTLTGDDRLLRLDEGTLELDDVWVTDMACTGCEGVLLSVEGGQASLRDVTLSGLAVTGDNDVWGALRVRLQQHLGRDVPHRVGQRHRDRRDHRAERGPAVRGHERGHRSQLGPAPGSGLAVDRRRRPGHHRRGREPHRHRLVRGARGSDRRVTRRA